MHRDPAQPIKHVLFGSQPEEFGVQFQKYVLGYFFRRGSIAEDTKSDAEDHGLMCQHQGTEVPIVVFYSGGQVALRGGREPNRLPLHSLIRSLPIGGMQKKRPALVLVLRSPGGRGVRERRRG